MVNLFNENHKNGIWIKTGTITQDEIVNSEIRALSCKQPFTSLMLHGKVETRTWDTKYRGLVLICASKVKYPYNTLIRISGTQIWRILTKLKLVVYDELSAFELGHAIAIGRLTDSRKMIHDDEEKCFVKYNPELFCHIYQDVTPIIPFEWKGSQGWRTLDKEAKAKVLSTPESVKSPASRLPILG